MRTCGNCIRCKEYGLLDGHHRLKRRYDKDNETVVYLCRRCHVWVESHPYEAELENLTFRRGINEKVGSGKVVIYNSKRK